MKLPHPNRFDVNGDGFGDVVATGCNGGKGGVAFVYLGGKDGLSTTPVVLPRPSDTRDECFYWIQGSADVDGDKRSELFISDRVYRGASPYVASAPLRAGRFDWEGDLNGEGYPDSITADWTDWSGKNAVALVQQRFGGPGNTVTSIPALFTNGATATMVGDLDRDGFGDVLICADGEGKALLYRGSKAGLAAKPVLTVYPPGTDPVAEKRYFGRSCLRAGDVNGDGLGDVLIGDSTVRLFIGVRRDGEYRLDPTNLQLEVANGVRAPVVPADVNGDGFDDLVVAKGVSLQVYLGGAAAPVLTQTVENADAPNDWPRHLYAGGP